MSVKGILTIVVAVAILAGSGFIIRSSFSTAVFNLEIRDILNNPEKYGSSEFKVAGDVTPGSIKSTGKFQIEFKLSDKEGRTIDCRYSGVVPDPFGEGKEVILLASLNEDKSLNVKKITVKCPSKYQEEGLSEEDYDKYYEEKYKKGHKP